MRATCLPRVALLIATVSLVTPTAAESGEPPVSGAIFRDGLGPLPDTESISSSADTVVYSNDFERTAGREWSLPITDITPNGGQRFLGQFGNDSVGLTLRDLPAHQSVMVTFDLYVIRTWDGNYGDFWALALADGRTLFRTTFSNSDGHRHRQAYPDASPNGNHHARTGADAVNTLGFRFGGTLRDSVYELAFTFDHSEPVLELSFQASDLEGLADESWGLDNVRVIVRDEIVVSRSEGDRALTFDGTDDCVVIPSKPSLDIEGSLTLEARVRNDGDVDGQIIWRGDARSGHDPYQLHLTDGRMDFRIDADFRGRHMGFPAKSREPVDGGWHFWTGVYDKDAGMVYLYKDGVLEAAEEMFGEITYDTSPMWNMIGAVDRGSWQHFKGSIHEVRIWNVARSPAEVRRDMTRRLSGREEGLVACWRFDQKIGQIAHDISTNHNHGVLGGSALPDKADPTRAKGPASPRDPADSGKNPAR